MRHFHPHSAHSHRCHEVDSLDQIKDDCAAHLIKITKPILLISFAVTYKSKLWRNEIAAKKRMMRGKNTTKADIHFHLATSRWR